MGRLIEPTKLSLGMLKQTRSSENYLKALYKLSGYDFGGLTHGVQASAVGTTVLAAELDTKASSVTDMLQKLARKGLVVYKPYYGALLTDSGIRLAIEVVRRHRLWEYFLATRLGFGMHEIHDMAEELEHIRSLTLTDRLDRYLGHPLWDPHGDPIPNPQGRTASIPSLTLLAVFEGAAFPMVRECSEVQEGTRDPEEPLRWVGITRENPQIIKDMNAGGLRFGRRFTLAPTKGDLGQPSPIQLMLHQGERLEVSHEVAGQMRVVPGRVSRLSMATL